MLKENGHEILLATELMADISRLGLRQGDACRLTVIPLQEGVELLVWNCYFAEPFLLALQDDSERVHFTYVLQGKCSCEILKQRGNEAYEVGEGAGIISFGPDRKGRFVQQGDYASVTVMIRPDVLAAWDGGLDGGLRQAVDVGDCFLGGVRGAELHSTAQLLSCSVHQPELAASRASARHRLWLEGQGLSLVGLFLESRTQFVGQAGSISECDRAKLYRARDRLLSDLAKAPSLPELALCSGLSLLKLKRGFKAMFGHSVYDFFMQERMGEARRRLSLHGVSVTEVAVDLGYTNVSHFAAAFRKRFGVSPRTFKC